MKLSDIEIRDLFRISNPYFENSYNKMNELIDKIYYEAVGLSMSGEINEEEIKVVRKDLEMVKKDLEMVKERKISEYKGGIKYEL
ncbi:MAG: hypothetical protein OWT28_06475 [Firmicutes bacterium]|nr:hypothetical protein [Bacillota bacterium]